MIASVILGLYLLGIIGAESAVPFLLITGVLLIAAEFFLVGGIFAFNGIIALLIGQAIRSGTNEMFGFPLDWGLFFGIAFVEFSVLLIAAYIFLHYRKSKISTGPESMIGQKATVIEWQGQSGRVRIQGEIWQASSDKAMDLKPDEKVTVESVNDLTLKINF